jgi:hypothetical protein
VCVDTVGAASAGAIAAAVTSPLDIIKTRIQVGSDYKGAVDAARRIWTEEGPRAFTKVLTRPTLGGEWSADGSPDFAAGAGYGREDTVDCSRHHHHHGCLYVPPSKSLFLCFLRLTSFLFPQPSDEQLKHVVPF